MFSLYLLGRFQFYTNKSLAEKEASRFIKKHLIEMWSPTHNREFDEAYCQERYADCITLWNRVVQLVRSDSFYQAQVSAVEIDKPFW